MLDTQAIYLTRLEYLEHDDDEYGHPAKERWPFWPGWEICGICGAIIRPADWVPFLAEHLLEVCYDAR